jgi:DNA-directed RNA polymerase subunit RPC12/RpoP
MAIEFRCTGCRSRLHVPERREGTTVTCPKCGTRVVVPAAERETAPARFEQRDVERSLAMLEAGRGVRTRGGVFADESFSLPDAGDADAAAAAVSRPPAGLTLPRWAIYAYVVAMMGVAVAAFLAGQWWPGGR